ncbi:(2Fe-2S)-binding protein [Longibacter salinarum]|uniref:(2Fe-2S)-binding protein n=1 Tax=Longibacter salinarum TaxID=1850348 RepID=A0A2A8CYT1_9BACT|nr:2Fe-2S iron-sulfur cluster-binding protein [Longibacter salinarum]PEN13845.1 (2Fe-2S)-binding protein [Longibacter salinarum]
MPKLTIQGEGTFEVEDGTRLVRAIEQSGVEVGHRCGGHASCTTCRVEFADGEPEVMTQAEHDKLSSMKKLGQMRLSCQIVVDRDMTVKPLMWASKEGWDDNGPEPAIQVEPEPEWHAPQDLEESD